MYPIDIAYPSKWNVYIRYPKKSRYNTARALLIELLDDDNNDTVMWIQKNQTFKIVDSMNLQKIWEDRETIDPICQMSGLNCDFLGATEPVPNEQATFRLLTKSTEPRKYQRELFPGALHEWIIKFLREQIRVDWVQYTNKENLEFQILDYQAFGEAFADFNGRIKLPGAYLIKMLMSSYCIINAIRKIGKDRYQFNGEWYNKEINKKPDHEFGWFGFEKFLESTEDFQ